MTNFYGIDLDYAVSEMVKDVRLARKYGCSSSTKEDKMAALGSFLGLLCLNGQFRKHGEEANDFCKRYLFPKVFSKL